MKNIKYIMLAFACCLFTGCMEDGWEAPTETGRGNTAFATNNVISINELKTNFAKYIDTDYRDGVSYRKVEDDCQIKGYVTGNDIEGNMYQEISIEDSTGAIIISLSDGNLCGYLPLGTEIIVSMKDLYVGNYGRQAEIGYPYMKNDSTAQLGRLNRFLWNQHFNYTGRHKDIEPIAFDKATWDKNPMKYAGRLAYYEGEFNVSSDTVTYANASAGAGNKTLFFKNADNHIEVYNSNYADFASMHVPTGKVRVTGVVKRYNSYWEFIIRSVKDVEVIK